MIQRTDTSATPAAGCVEPNQQPPPDHETRIEAVLPIAEERLKVEKRRVVTGRVRIDKSVHEREQVVDEPLFAEDVEVERVAVNRIVDDPPKVRHEGEVLIVPLVEEVLVKRLLVREEVHIRRRRREIHEPQVQVVRYEQARVERISGSPGTESDGTNPREPKQSNKEP